MDLLIKSQVQKPGTIYQCMSPQNAKRVLSQQINIREHTQSGNKIPKIDDVRLKQFQKLLSTYMPSRSPQNKQKSGRNSVNESNVQKSNTISISDSIMRLVNSVTPQKADAHRQSGVIRNVKQLQYNQHNNMCQSLSSQTSEVLNNSTYNKINQDQNNYQALQKIYARVKMRFKQYEDDKKMMLLENQRLQKRIIHLEELLNLESCCDQGQQQYSQQQQEQEQEQEQEQIQSCSSFFGQQIQIQNENDKLQDINNLHSNEFQQDNQCTLDQSFG